AQVRLAKIKAGAKIGAIHAQVATVDRLKAELDGQMIAQTATIDRIEAELRNAQTECGRYQALYQEGAIAVSMRDNLCLREETFREQLKEAKATHNRTEETLLKQVNAAKATLDEVTEVRPVDVAIAQAELDRSKAGVFQARANLDLAYVRTPQAGQVLKIYTWPGEVVAEKGIVAIGKTDRMYAIAEVYETDVYQIRLGQRATITSKGFDGKLSGTVEETGLQIGKKNVLNTDPAADVDARVVEVKICLDPASSQKVSHLTNLQVNVIIHLKTEL
ncbi:MAG: HlyD family efflux transporter periplasmic adaptor subunit, partial [Microcystaceae cyanobacterium]